MKFSVIILAPYPKDTSWRGLLEVASGVAWSLQKLGHEVSFIPGGSYSDLPINSRLIVFNAHAINYTTCGVNFPADTIFFNSEQIKESWSNTVYINLLKTFTTWDYSSENIARLEKLTGKRAIKCRVGYYPGLSSIKPAKETTDILFIGSMNGRRQAIANTLAKRGIRSKFLFDIYGDYRDHEIAQAKLVLNIHYYEKPIFEVFRVSYLLANKKCVVSEANGTDAELEAFAAQSTAHVPYDALVNVCESLLASPDGREEIANRGFYHFSQTDQIFEVKQALEQCA